LTFLTGRRIAAAALLLATLALGIYGIGRSLWLDEAWVANSVLQPSLSGMFWYPEWLQSTPPLFLLLVRGTVGLVGTSNAAFRIVPLAFAVVGVGAMIALTRRLLPEPFALLASALLAFHPTAIEYSRTCKQYSAELAMSAVILLALVLCLESPVRRRFVWLCGIFIVALPLAWAAIFLLPGAVIAVWAKSGLRRAFGLASVTSAWLAILYFEFIRQNVAPQLRAFWTSTAKPLSPGLTAVLIFCIVASAIAIFRRNWVQIAALSACLLFAVADLLRLYPAEPRSRLFLLPCFLLVAAAMAQDIWNRTAGNRNWAGVAIALLVIGLGVDAGRKQIRDRKDRPEEDYQGAVALLRRRVSPSDVLLVHASVLEGFRLYAAMDGWRDNHAIIGDTGAPCCARSRNALPHSSRAGDVYADIDRMVPPGFVGRLWLMTSSRPAHWAYIGNDESRLWKSRLAQRGCTVTADTALRNIAITTMDCVEGK